MGLLRLGGFRAVRITTIWEPGMTRAGRARGGRARERRGRGGSCNGVRVFVSVYHAGSRTTPLTPEAQAEFAAYAAALATANPSFRDLIVGNEPNLNRFWLPQFNLDGTGASAPAYLRCSRRPTTRSRPSRPTPASGAGRSRRAASTGRARAATRSRPTRFLRELGQAYRASGRAEARDGRLRVPPVRGELERPGRPGARPTRTTSASPTRTSSCGCSDRRSTAPRRWARACRSSTTSTGSSRS